MSNSVTLTVMRYSFKLQLLKVQMLASPQSTVFSGNRKFSLLFEIFIYLPQPYPFLAGMNFSFSFLDLQISTKNYFDNREIDYYINELLSLCLVLRLLIVIRVILTYSKWISHRSNRIW